MSRNKFIPAHSLRTKILIGYVFIFLLVAVFIYTYFPLKYKQQAIKAIEFKIESIVDMMSIGVGIGMGELDLVAIGEVLSWAKKDQSLVYIVVLNQEKEEVSTYTAGNAAVNVKELLKNRDDSENNRILHYHKPLIYQNEHFGTLLIGYSLQPMDQAIAQQKQISLYVCLAIFGFGLVLSIFISTGITGNITKLSKVVNEIAEGNTNTQVTITSDDEIGKLADAFNDMISRLNRSREELLSSNQYTENILMSMIDSLLVLDETHTIVRVNQAACHLLGYTYSEIINQPIDHFFGTHSFSNAFLPLLQQQGHIQNQESIFKTKTGASIQILFSASLLKDYQGSLQGVVCVAQDISIRKRAEEQLKVYSQKLEKSNQELQKFNYVVSHDLKAPLHGLFKLSEWIEVDPESTLSDESRKHFEMLKGRVLRMEALINGLLAYYKTGQFIKLPELVQTEQLLTEVIQHLAPPPTCAISIQPNMPTFVTQRKRLQHVFMHLIGNAIRFNDKQKGWIRISAIEYDTYYQFVVEDNGPGIDSTYFEKIFVIFQTLQARDKVESTGMGLTIAKRIVEEQNGKIWVESTLGQGSAFSFTWPKES